MMTEDSTVPFPLMQEAQKRVCKGDPLPKDMYNTVMKWSSMSPKEEDVSRVSQLPNHCTDKLCQTYILRSMLWVFFLQGGGQRREKKSTSHGGLIKEGNKQDLKKEEEELRQELKNMRELTQSNIYLLEENKRLMRKVMWTSCINAKAKYFQHSFFLVFFHGDVSVWEILDPDWCSFYYLRF